MIEVQDIDALYNAQLKAFRETHEPVLCAHCKKKIMPGDDLYTFNRRVYCEANCVSEELGELLRGTRFMTFDFDGKDDQGYRSIFGKKV